MSAIVVDTNVLLVADGQAEHMSAACMLECLRRIERMRASEQVVLDRDWIILGEYQRKLDPSRRPPSVGGAFVKHLLENFSNRKHVSLVRLTATDGARTEFAEFPDDPALKAAFDPNDRKFAAAANAHPDRPSILQATDSKWLGWEAGLRKHGLRLEVLCRKEMEAIHERKKAKS